jgi:hypothetical protein
MMLEQPHDAIMRHADARTARVEMFLKFLMHQLGENAHQDSNFGGGGKKIVSFHENPFDAYKRIVEMESLSNHFLFK